MNWRVGLLRLWIVAAAIWFVIVLGTAWTAYPHVAFSLDTLFNWARETLPDLAGWLLIPPLAALVVVAALLWALRGFRAR